MAIPENDKQLWKGFGHGLYSKRAERDVDGLVIDQTYAKKADVPALDTELSASTTTAITPKAVKDAIAEVDVIPELPQNPSSLYSEAAGSMVWGGWETEEMDIPEKIPQHCVILDYFRDGYRFGKAASASVFTSVETALPTDFNIQTSSTFGQSVPFARFDGTGTLIKSQSYNLEDIVNSATGFTVEYYIRTAERNDWVRDTVGLGPNDFKIMISNYNEGLYGYSTGGWSWGTLSLLHSSGGNIIESSWYSAWHHVAYTVTHSGSAGDEYDKVQLYVDGYRLRGLSHSLTDWRHSYPYSDPYTIWMYNYMNDSNNRYKLGYYDIAQLAVWDYPKYDNVDTYQVPTKFYID